MKKFRTMFFVLLACTVSFLSSCKKDEVVKVTEVFLNHYELNLEPGQTAQLTEAVLPVGAEYKAVWISSDENVAKVSEDGLITALTEGEAEVRVLVNDISAVCKVAVKESVEEIKIKLNPESKKIKAGMEFVIEATVTPAGKYQELVWASSDEGVASVDKGTVTGVKPGKAVITASIGDVKAECAVEVLDASSDVVIIDLNIKEKDLYVGESFELKATVTPVDREKDLKWKSSDENVVTVDAEGMVKAVAEGNAQIIASIDDVEEICNVTVKKVESDLTITLEPMSKEITVGGSFQVTATVDPYDRKDELEWRSSDNSVVTVAPDGLVTAKAEGKAQIIASIDDVEAVCEVTVVAESMALVFTIDEDEVPLLMEEETSHSIRYTVEPVERMNDVVWKSSDPEIADFEYDNNRIYAYKEGQVTVTGEIDGITQSIEVKVVAAPAEVTLDRTSATIQISETLQLNASVRPASAQDKPVVWSVDNSSVASVSEEGLVTGLAEGVAVIKAQVDQSVAECRVVVTAEAGEIKTEWELYEIFDVPGYGKGMVVRVNRDWFDDHVKSITVMHMEFPELQWAKDPAIIVGNGTADFEKASGMELTEMIAKQAKLYPDNFPAFNAVRALGPNWYMPNDNELTDYYGDRYNINAKLKELGYEEIPESVWGAKEGRDAYTNYASFIDNTYHYPRQHYKTAVRGTMALLKINFDEL